MVYHLLVRSLLALCLFCLFFVQASQDEFLEVEDIRGVMKEVFSQHIEKRQMTQEIARQSIQAYINKFDPHRTYLLEREVAPFIEMKGAQLDQVVEEYQKDDFSIFHKMNALFQKSIARNREIRELIEQDKAALFQKTSRDSGNFRHYARNIKELKGRVRGEMSRYIEDERRRFGDSFVMRYPDLVLGRYDQHLRDFENQYLYRDLDGHQLSKTEEENLFSLHVLKALANGIDSQTDVLSPKEALEMRTRLEKGHPGIGVMVQKRGDGVFITRVIEEGPAKKSGSVKVHDKILQIDGRDTNSLSLSEVVELLRGEANSKVNLVLERKVKEGQSYIGKQLPVQLVRQAIIDDKDRVHTTVEKVGNGVVGTIKLDSFYRGPNGISSVKDVEEAIFALDRENNLRGLILDLRDNSGGYLTEAVKVAGLFISNGVIVTAKYADGKEKVYRDLDTRRVYNGPLVILTSKGTASAAEIVAQALQDYGVAVVVGDEKTFGKGTIQNQTVTSDKGGSFFKVTVGKYYTVSGNTPQEKGVKADIVVPSIYSHLDFGDERIEYTSDGDKISAKFHDSLKGIHGGDRQWYLTYYVPSLQKKQTEWRDMIPYLEKNSSYRLSKNKNYQLFLKNTDIPDTTDEDEESASKRPKNYGMVDMQHAEAFHIVQDMISMHSHAGGDTKQARN